MSATATQTSRRKSKDADAKTQTPSDEPSRTFVIGDAALERAAANVRTYLDNAIDISKLEDQADVSVAERFRLFSLDAADVLSMKHEGDWLLEPLKTKAEFVCTVVVRMDEDGQFVIDHSTKVPNKARFARIVPGVGLVQLDLFADGASATGSDTKGAAGAGGKE